MLPWTKVANLVQRGYSISLHILYYSFKESCDFIVIHAHVQ